MTDAWVNQVFANQYAISSLFGAVIIGQQQRMKGLDFAYRYTSISAPTVNKLYGAGTLNTFNWIAQQMAGFGTYAQNIISTSTVVLPDGTTLVLDPIDVEVLILLAQMTPISNLYSGAKYARQYRAEGKTNVVAASGLADFTGTLLPTLFYGTGALITLGNANVVSNYLQNQTF
jgi:hypothetical protein